jgi:hypothetical protein
VEASRTAFASVVVAAAALHIVAVDAWVELPSIVATPTQRLQQAAAAVPMCRPPILSLEKQRHL